MIQDFPPHGQMAWNRVESCWTHHAYGSTISNEMFCIHLFSADVRAAIALSDCNKLECILIILTSIHLLQLLLGQLTLLDCSRARVMDAILSRVSFLTRDTIRSH